MKKLAILLTILTIGFQSNAQVEHGGQQTLFNNAKLTGGFIAFSVKPAYVNNKEAAFTGGQLAVGLGRKVNIGVAAYGLLTDVKSNQFDLNGNPYFVEMGYGGLLIEPVLGSNSMIHITTPIILGGGVSSLSRYRPWEYNYYNPNDYTDTEFFFVAEPSVNAELNVFKIMRVGAGVGYRWVGETGVFTFSGTDLSGWSANVTLKLGWF